MSDLTCRFIDDVQYTDINILLDTGSQCSVFKNRNMFLNIRVSAILMAYKNGGHQDSKMVEDFPGVFKVWLSKNLTVNILSFTDVRKRCLITMDTDVEKKYVAHRQRKEDEI